jgi:hypothetical protein
MRNFSFLLLHTYHEHSSLLYVVVKSKHKGQFFDLNHKKLLENFYGYHAILFFEPKEKQQKENEQQSERKQQNQRQIENKQQKEKKRKVTTTNSKYKEKKQQNNSKMKNVNKDFQANKCIKLWPDPTMPGRPRTASGQIAFVRAFSDIKYGANPLLTFRLTSHSPPSIRQTIFTVHISVH